MLVYDIINVLLFKMLKKDNGVKFVILLLEFFIAYNLLSDFIYSLEGLKQTLIIMIIIIIFFGLLNQLYFSEKRRKKILKKHLNIDYEDPY